MSQEWDPKKVHGVLSEFIGPYLRNIEFLLFWGMEGGGVELRIKHN